MAYVLVDSGVDDAGRVARWRMAHAQVEGDIDGLGLPDVEAEDWLEFSGVVVSLAQTTSLQAASEALGRHVVLDGLRGHATGTAFRFVWLGAHRVNPPASGR